ncbi:hypothetical protein [Aurantimonas sp. C2-3-R2]|uniref:hypothetical protein n=1 Tax=unclassified Aurantimonas TaxID=2638230 RepID=UPI003FA41A23
MRDAETSTTPEAGGVAGEAAAHLPQLLTLFSPPFRSALDDLGSVALGSDIAAMRHEALRTRLFRS